MEAADRGDLATIKKLVEQDPTVTKSLDPDHRSPLEHAVKAGHAEIVEYLLAHGVDPNVGFAGQGPGLFSSGRGTIWLRQADAGPNTPCVAFLVAANGDVT
jgi:ankyrin repeat protein